MPNALARHWKMFIPLGAVVLAALLWSIYWFTAFGVAKQHFVDERAKLAAQGLTLACTQEVWGGFPFHFEYTCAAPVVKFKDKAAIRSSSLLLVALAYAPWQVAALLDGPSTVTGEGIEPMDAQHQRIMAVATWDRHSNVELSADIPFLKIANLGNVDKIMAFTRPSSQGGTDIALSVTGLNYQPAGKAPLTVDQGELLGTLTPDKTLKLDKIELQQGKLRYWGSGTLSLDAVHRVAGRIDTETNDLNALLDALNPHIPLTEQQASGLRAMLGLLGNDAKAPLIAKDGILYFGPFRITELMPLY